ncbi:2-keto-3-deoxygluconate kinase [Actinomyces sp. Chiba101]|uniref:2-dehydro-3-deoxygluconokinase n=1 Tax=Actinomyces denticolens TaxID=52767 RepID=A0ABY1I289_9ACTO|nr:MULTISPECIES: sugar kinase [Actinomyces]BAW92409.1 2-keto-3-deoxygluconate kinase [Actinomyces sp. Chiba101]GAV94647.1 2-keto-3-deoxygluconate kinase [Actinomyces denticolens]SHI48682.1 2-dehydro-3-deoxygluconokinase [Actinomyces denticolens]SUU09319.1 5-dehydro-2-deoxygluconokinase [Actinomyces denticolens]
MTYDLSTIGEGQIRLTCERGDRLVTARTLRMTAAGSEANVAGLLSELGRSTTWASKLPKGELADRIALEYSAVGVDMSHVVLTEEGRVALYFLEPGEFPLPGKVTYDRQHTPFRSITPADFDWESLLDTRVVFLTGITAALTPETAGVVRYFADAARERGVDIALDVNFRSLLWSGEQAREVLEPIARMSSILFCSRTDARIVFGVDGEGVEACRNLREAMGVPTVVSTDGRAGTYLSSEGGERVFDIKSVTVVDRPGAGDSFVAGTLHGWLDGDVVAGIGMGTRVAQLALTHHGDLTHVRPGELALLGGSDIVR